MDCSGRHAQEMLKYQLYVDLWPQLSKVLKPVLWAGSVPFPPVSLQRQVVCLLLRPVFMCYLRGEPTLFPGWLVYK